MQRTLPSLIGALVLFALDRLIDEPSIDGLLRFFWIVVFAFFWAAWIGLVWGDRDMLRRIELVRDAGLDIFETTRRWETRTRYIGDGTSDSVPVGEEEVEVIEPRHPRQVDAINAAARRATWLGGVAGFVILVGLLFVYAP